MCTPLIFNVPHVPCWVLGSGEVVDGAVVALQAWKHHSNLKHLTGFTDR